MADESCRKIHEDWMWAVKNEDLDRLKELIATDRSYITKILGNGRHVMCIAADFGQLEVLQFLTNEGADVNAVDNFGMTPLLCAVYENHMDCVKFLLSKGAKKTSPEGKPYSECANTSEIRDMLK